MKKTICILTMVALTVISIKAYAALSQVETVVDENIPQVSSWNTEWGNIYNNPDNYLEGISITNGTITTTTGTTFTGGINATTITATGGTTCSSIDSSTITGADYDNVITHFKYTAIAVGASPYTVSNGDSLLIDTTGGGVEILCPASPSVGWVFSYTDAKDYFSTNGLTINPNGKLFRGNGASFVTSGTTSYPDSTNPVTNMVSVNCVYGSVSSGWVYYNHGYDD